VAPAGAKQDEDKGVAEVATDLWQLVRDYAKQETVDPLKRLTTFFKWGVPGAFAMAFGLVFVTLGVLRGLQTHTDQHLSGHLTWVPYLAALVVDLLVIAWAVLAIKRPYRGEEKDA
jgi:hypothetical protein